MARLVVCAVAFLVALAGCGGDPKAEPSPSASVTTPVATTLSATPPTLPPAADANTKAGAIAFVRHYIQVFNFAQRTGDYSGLSALSSIACDECDAVTDGLKQIYGAQGHIEGGDLRIDAATAQFNAAEGVWLALVRVRSGPQVVIASHGAEPSERPGGVRSMNFSLEHHESGWKVSAWTRA